MRLHARRSAVLLLWLGLYACQGTDSEGLPALDPASASAGAGGDRSPLGGAAGGLAGRGGTQTGGSGAAGAGGTALKQTEVGAYRLGAELTGDNAPASVTVGEQGAGGCSVMTAVVRDFRGADETGGHPDFETFEGKQPTKGLVSASLGEGGKPVYASMCEASPDSGACPYGQMTTSKVAFDAWYRTTAGTNRAYVLDMHFAANGAGVYTFQSNAFFPLDGAGFENSGGGKRRQHNYHFTTEVHARFLYSGGERFSFTGDDDLWVFINGRLAIDLGGLHPQTSATLDLDSAASALGIVKGQEYALELFHAERHTTASNFRVDTTLAFTECGGSIPPQ